LDPAARALTRLFPERAGEPDPGRALFLDETALETPYLALANATREVLRMADIVEGMLNRAMQAMGARDRAAIDAVERTGKAVERLRDAIKSYLSRLAAEPLAEPDSRRAGIMLDLVVNLGHAAGIVERTLAATAARTIKRGVALTAEDEADIAAFHARVAAALRLSISTFLTGDPRSAHELLDAKRRLNETERAATRAHLARLDPCRPERLEASTMYLALLRDLRRINSHLSAIAYDVLEIGAPGGDEAVERDAESEGVGN
jgi:phosphate:Na+ symporter